MSGGSIPGHHDGNDNNLISNHQYMLQDPHKLHATAKENEPLGSLQVQNKEGLQEATGSALPNITPLSPNITNTNHGTTINNSEFASIRPKRMRTDRAKLGGAYVDCCKMITNLLNHRHSHPFAQPVNPLALGIPDYPTLIKRPMDLSTIQKKLNNNEYTDADEFAEDVRLVWSNCESYNGPTHSITSMAHTLSKIFEKSFSQLKTKSFDDTDVHHTKSKSPRPLKKSPRVFNSTPHSSTHGEMTITEKRQLCAAINHMDPKYLGKVIQIINKSVPNILDMGGEEIEISVETLGNNTLRELEDYVNEVRQSH